MTNPERHAKFGLTKLDWMPATKDNVNPVAQETPMTDKWQEQAMDKYRQKWGLDHFETEHVSKPTYTIDEKPTTLIQADIDRREYLRQKFNLKGNSLLCEGLLGLRLEAREQSLAERVIDDDRERSKGMKLSLARVDFQGKKVLLAVEVSKF